MDLSEKHTRLSRAKSMSRVLDQRYVDPILGFVLPGVGDSIGAVFGSYLVYVGYRQSVHPVVMARMLLNLLVDALLGAIPLAGVFFDVFFKANTRNLKLLEARGAYRQTKPSDWLIFAAACLLFIVALVSPILIVAVAVAALI